MVLYYCDLLFGRYPSSLCFANTTFRGVVLPSSSGEPTLLGPVDSANLYRYFCLRLQGRYLPTSLHGVKTQNNVVILTAVRTSNITQAVL
jgi:hypothetical protein